MQRFHFRPITKKRLLSSLTGTLLTGGGVIVFALWGGTGSGGGSGSIGTITPPTLVTVSSPAGTDTVSVSWGAATVSGGATPDGYYVQRYLGATPSDACGSSLTTLLPASYVSCTDLVVSDSTYTYTVTAIFRTWTAVSVASASVIVSGANQFLVSSPTPTAGVAFNVTITAENAASATATNYTGTKTITFTGPANSPNNTAPIYPATVTFTSGVGTASITLYNAVATTLTAAQSTLTGSTGSFVVSPKTASALTVNTPATATAGVAFSSTTLVAIDMYGNTATSYTGSHTITWSGAPNAPNGQAPSYPTTTVSFTAGISTTTLTATLYDAATYTLVATESSSSDTGSKSITVSPGSASFSIPTPATQAAGTSFNVTMTAWDSWQNVVTSYTGSKVVSFSGPANSPYGNAPTYPASVTFTSGVGTASITLYNAAAATLTATSGSITGTTGSFTVSNLAASTFRVVPPATSTAGTAFSTTVIYGADVYGNTDSTFAGNCRVVFSGANTSPNATVPTYPAVPHVTFAAGVSSTTLTMTFYAAGVNNLTATWTTFTGTGKINIADAGASTYTVATPASQTAGTPFNLSVTAYDAYGNLATSDTGSQSVTYSGPANSPNATAPLYPASTTFVAGVATPSVTLYNAASNMITATLSTVTGTSGSFSVAPLTYAAFKVNVPATASVATAFNLTSLVAVDMYGNTATSYTGSHTIAWSGANASPSGTAPTYPVTAVSFTSGVSTTTLTATLYSASSNVITATDGTHSGTSSAIAVTTALAITRLAWVTTSFTAGSCSYLSGNMFGISYTSCGTTGSLVTWQAFVATTDAYGNQVAVKTNGGLSVTLADGAVGTLSTTTLNIPKNASVSSTFFTYTSSGSGAFWSDTVQATGTYTATSANFHA